MELGAVQRDNPGAGEDSRAILPSVDRRVPCPRPDLVHVHERNPAEGVLRMPRGPDALSGRMRRFCGRPACEEAREVHRNRRVPVIWTRFAESDEAGMESGDTIA